MIEQALDVLSTKYLHVIKTRGVVDLMVAQEQSAKTIRTLQEQLSQKDRDLKELIRKGKDLD